MSPSTTRKRLIVKAERLSQGLCQNCGLEPLLTKRVGVNCKAKYDAQNLRRKLKGALA